MKKLTGIANTLFVPLVARVYISKKFPEYFYDPAAIEIEKILPDHASRGSTQYSHIASVARAYQMDHIICDFIKTNESCNVIYLGAGLDSGCERTSLQIDTAKVNYYAVDFPEVIELRKKLYEHRFHETCISGDMLTLQWCHSIDTHLPAILIISGVFQYFHEDTVLTFIKQLKRILPDATLVFDCTNQSGLKLTNRFIRKTGNPESIMYFYVNNAYDFAQKCDTILLEERLFFPEARQILKSKLSTVTRICMYIADRKKQTKILVLKLTRDNQKK